MSDKDHLQGTEHRSGGPTPATPLPAVTLFVMERVEGAWGTLRTVPGQERPASARPGRLTCLNCRETNQLVLVEAAYREGRTVVNVRSRGCVLPGYPMSFRARGVRVSSLATALAPPRTPGGNVIRAAVLGFPALLVLAGLTSRLGPSAGSWVSLAAFVVVALIFWLRRRTPAPDRRQAQRALWLWRRCWYCRRCGHVSLLSPGTSAILPAARLTDSLLELANRLQWRPIAAETKEALSRRNRRV